ncbi:MAG TPA: ABC transporter ATP-binding protein [Anaerolineales bacterium]|nr:ABC transporter ATP-binding protein [Anaerolineales bacterium]
MNEYAIRTEQLSCHFGAIRAVDNLSLEIPKGIVFGFLGPNGSGKTTTIRLLLGLLEPSQGRACVLGFDTQTQSEQIRNSSGALLEHSGLYERLSAHDNLEFYGRIYRMDRSKLEDRIKDLLTHFGLWERRHERVGHWSRGMKQKVAIARTLLHRPSLIFLDEPTAGLDPIAAASLRDDIAALVENDDVTVFLNTHNLPEAEKLCAEVGVIRNGRLLSVGSLDQLRREEDSSHVVITGSGFTQEILDQLRTQPIVKAVIQQNSHLEITLTDLGNTSSLLGFLINAGAQVEEVHKNKASLEDVFLKMMEEDSNAA